jgi:hypothetical protein
MKIILALLLCTLTACATGPDLTSLSKPGKAVVICANWTNLGGGVAAVTAASVDTGALDGGQMIVDNSGKCGLSVGNGVKPAGNAVTGVKPAPALPVAPGS